MRIDALADGFGLLGRPTEKMNLSDIPKGWVIEQLSRSDGGLLLLRGFDADIDAFRQFTEAYGGEFLVHQNLEIRDYIGGDKTFAMVHPGKDAIDFHIEMASNPIKADVLWLHCVNPALQRGRIGFADGKKVLSKLTARTRARIEAGGFMYRFVGVPPAAWKPLWQALMGELPDDAGRLYEQVLQYGAQNGVSDIVMDDREQLSFNYYHRPIRRSKFSDVPVFVSGLLDSPGNTLMSDGLAVDQHIRLEVTQACYQDAVWIDWQAGDVAVIDNTRVMHAREAFEDDQRRVLIRYSRHGSTPVSN
jgi:hypothetical protein